MLKCQKIIIFFKIKSTILKTVTNFERFKNVQKLCQVPKTSSHRCLFSKRWIWEYSIIKCNISFLFFEYQSIMKLKTLHIFWHTRVFISFSWNLDAGKQIYLHIEHIQTKCKISVTAWIATQGILAVTSHFAPLRLPAGGKEILNSSSFVLKNSINFCSLKKV